MTAIKTEIRRGVYYDSIVLMQLQVALADLPGVNDVGVMMGTAANKELMAQSGLLTSEAEAALADDLILVVQSEAEALAASALEQVDTLLTRRRTALDAQDYLPQSLEAATHMLPDAGWVLVSVPGRYAAGVARESLRLGKHVFIYSDNVSLEDEIALKTEAAKMKLLVMGPDCGTAIINGVGLGFANKVRRGSIGIVGASGTGLQQVTTRIHQLGGGISHALGTGGRDLSEAVAGITAHQALALLSQDTETKVIVLISKPPAHVVADTLLRTAAAIAKPVVINFIGYSPPANVPVCSNLHFSYTLDQAAELAVQLANTAQKLEPAVPDEGAVFAAGQRYLRGIFSGGTLAYEALLILQGYASLVYSNAPLDRTYKLANALESRAHTIIDLGEDEFTVGRLHPMMDNSLRIQRLKQEAADPEVAIILLDVVLGYGAHPDPAAELAPAISEVKTRAAGAGRDLEVVTILTGTDEDPQDLARQADQLREAGARIFNSNEAAIHHVGRVLRTLNSAGDLPAVDISALNQPLIAINVGLESFTQSLIDQEATVLHVNWRPPAGGNQKLMGILERMKKR